MKKKELTLVELLKRIVPMTYSASPKWFISNCAFAMLHGISWGLLTLSMQWFIDSVTKVSSGEATDSYAFAMLFVLIGITIFQKLINSISNFLVGNYFSFTNGVLNRQLFNKLDKIDPLSFEDPSVLDDINKANEGKVRSNLLLNIPMMIVTFYLPYYLFMSVYLFKLKPLFLLFIPLVFIPVILSQLIRTKLYRNSENEIAPYRRKMTYYQKAICDPIYLKETRFLDGYNFFKKKYNNVIGSINKIIWKSDFRASIIELAAKGITLLGYMGVLVLLIISLLNNEISVGAFAAVFTSISTLFSLFEDIACGMVGRLTRNIGSVQNFVRFLDLPEREGDSSTVVPEQIEFKNVSFSYPMQETHAIKNVSFVIPPKKSVAIVGQNGSGKTTLIKLITGLYLPTEGDVVLGGHSTRDVSIDSISKNISGVFQNFQKYKMSLSENITISQLELKNDILRIDESLKVSEFELNSKLSEGYNTILSREFDGVDLSGGEWQKIAVARGYFRNHLLLIMDEPTSAIDPIEESKLYEKFKSLSNDKTSIVTTHRLGAAKGCDIILVMKDGELVEQGSHDELIKQNGHYAMMYNSQSQWYV